MNNKIIGKVGENLASKYLKMQGYEILTTNYRSGRNEIDIIAKIQDFIVFVEVKYRNSIKYGYPEEMVSGQQEDRIRDAAESFMAEYDWKGGIRFDIIAITAKNLNSIFHIRDAF